MDALHRPVLLQAAVNALLDGATQASAAGGVYVDGTFGRGGHARALLGQLPAQARLVVFDKDPEAIAAARDLQREDARVQVVHGGFGGMAQALADLGIAQVQGILLDLGVSSPQLDEARRGFSFMRDGPLDMRMDSSQGITAAQWLAQAGIDDIKKVIKTYGEERFAFQIAKAIVARRASRALTTTRELAQLIESVVRTREKGQHPATRSFQALRIHINREIQELACGLKAALRLLAPGGRLAVISFHSLEDRMVKGCITAAQRRHVVDLRLPIPEKDMPAPILQAIARIRADDAEKAANPRARSAVLRVAQRTDAPLPLHELGELDNLIVRLAPLSDDDLTALEEQG